MKIWKITTLAVLFLAFIFVWIFFIGFSADQPGSFYNKGNNAVWLGHEWVGQDKSDIDVWNLVDNLKKHQIGTVFVHVGPLKEDGSIAPETYQYALSFIEKAKKYDDKIQYQAWMGQIRGKIDLSKEEVRHNVTKQALIMAKMVGFDGIHFDIEPVWDGDENFITTLKETRAMLGDDKIISVALAEFIPRWLVWLSQSIHKFENYNTEVNYKNVAKYADQIVVMAYDTGFGTEAKYEWLVKEQTIWVTKMLDRKQVFIGIPAYEETKDGFDPKVENIRSGLLGIIAGLNNSRSNEANFAGVAVYPYWEISEDEWKTYDEVWGK